jgi:hypothetical protein
MLVTHRLLRKTPPAPGLALRLQSVCEPRRRDRLPEEAMSEGARHPFSRAPVWLESLGRLFAKRTPRPKAAGPDAGAAQDELTGLREKPDHYGQDLMEVAKILFGIILGSGGPFRRMKRSNG